MNHPLPPSKDKHLIEALIVCGITTLACIAGGIAYALIGGPL